jgi:glycosyltransferase involved in cell wall biosynthesis
MPGFKQYDELPAYYAFADLFVHASRVEQWGLVVNEAMACGLPVVVSRRCGCVPELVREGVNGYSFDPDYPDQLAELLAALADDVERRTLMGKASSTVIADWSPRKFAEALWRAAGIAGITRPAAN